MAYGAQATALTPRALSLRYSTAQVSSSWWVRKATLPSLPAEAQTRPCSWGAKATPFADESCRPLAAWMTDQDPGELSRWIWTEPSNEHEARTTPNLGCAQDTSHTGPSCPWSVAVWAYWFPETS